MQVSPHPLPRIAPLNTQATPSTPQFVGMAQRWPSQGMSWQGTTSRSSVYPLMHSKWHPTTMCPPLPGFRRYWLHNPTWYNLAHSMMLRRIHSPSQSGIWCPFRLPMCILSWTGPTGALGASGRSRHQRRTRNGVRGIARLAALRTHTMKGPQWHPYGLTTGVLPRGHQNTPPNAPGRCTAPKPPVEHTAPRPTGAGPVTLVPD